MSDPGSASLSKPSILPGWTRLPCTLALLGALLLNFLVAERHDGQRCVELLLLAFCAATVILRRGRIQASAAMGRTMRLSLSGFFTLGLASAIAAWSLRHALYEWSSLLLLALLAFVVATEVGAAVGRHGDVVLLRILQAAGFACLLYALRVVLMYAAALANGYQIDMHGLAVGFSNVRFLNHAQTALLPVLVLLALRAPEKGALRRIWFGLTAFWWALLYVSEARASVLALAAGCAAVFLLRRHHARGFLRTMVMTAMVGGVVYAAAFILLPVLAGLQPLGSAANLMARTASDPASGRQFLWARGWALITAHPWLGAGPLHYAHYGAGDVQFAAHPHNWMFQFGAEWGMPALACIVAVTGAGMRALLRAGRRIVAADFPKQQILVTFLACIVAILVDGLFSGVFVMPQSRLAIVLVIGCAAGWVRSLDGQAAPAQAPAPLVRHATAALALAAACVLAWAVAPDVVAHARQAPLNAAEAAANQGMHWPRMWEAGFF